MRAIIFFSCQPDAEEKKETGRCGVFHLLCFLVKKCINYYAQNSICNNSLPPLTILKRLGLNIASKNG